MKTIVVLIAVAMALVGAVAAWDDTNYLTYNYAKVVNMQGDLVGSNNQDASNLFNGGQSSSASFSEPNAPYGAQSATVSNQVFHVTTVPVLVQNHAADEHDVLTQWGSATVGSKSPATEDPCAVKEFGTATAGSNMAVSGLFTGFQAETRNTATIVIGTGLQANTAFEHLDSSALPEIEAEPSTSTKFTDANLGSQATVGLTQLVTPGALPTLSGSFSEFGGFSGAYNPSGVAAVDVDLAGIEQDFWTGNGPAVH